MKKTIEAAGVVPLDKPLWGQTKYCPEVADKIVEAIKNGLSRKDAAALAGIGARTLYDWLDEDGQYYKPELSHRVQEADAAAIAFATSVLTKAMEKGDVKAAIAFLQAKRPEEWGFKHRVDHANADGKPFKQDTTFEIVFDSAPALTPLNTPALPPQLEEDDTPNDEA